MLLLFVTPRSLMHAMLIFLTGCQFFFGGKKIIVYVEGQGPNQSARLSTAQWTPRPGYRQVVPTFRVGSSWANLGPSAPGSRSGSPALAARSAIHATRTVTSTHTAPRVPYNSPVPPSYPAAYMGPSSPTTAPLTTRRVHLSYYV